MHNVAANSDKLSKRSKYANKTLNEGSNAVVRPEFDPAKMLFDDIQVSESISHSSVGWSIFSNHCVYPASIL
jgi:hypothetical protein